MDIGKILSDPGAAATLIGVVLAAILTLIITVLVQIWGERRKQLQVAYSRKMETPSILARSGINKNLHISYQGRDVTNLRYFSVNIINTGKKPISDFQFACEFDINIQAIDPQFPEIHTEAPPAIQPDKPLLDQASSTTNKFQYIVKSLAVGQKIAVNFLFANSKTDMFEVRFIHPQYEIREGNISAFTTLERNIISVLVNSLLFYVISQASPVISLGLVFVVALLITMLAAVFDPSFSSNSFFPGLFNIYNQVLPILSGLGDLVGTIVGLPFLLRAYRSARPIIPIIAKKLQEKL